MQFELSLVQLITICSIVNGLLFGTLVLEKKENRKANRFLSLLIIALCLTFTPYMLDPAIWDQYRWLAWLPFSLSYWIGPSLYLYVRALTSSIAVSKKDGWHFTPIILNYLHSIYHLFIDRGYAWFHHTAELLESAAIISILIYAWITYKQIGNYQQSLQDQVSNTDRLDLQWIKKVIQVLVLSFLLILLFMVLSSAILGKTTLDDWDNFREFILLIYAMMLYWISINGFRQAQTIIVPTFEEEVILTSETSEIIVALHALMKDRKLFRNAELSLSDLSRDSGISGRLISKALNQELGKNYFQFINEFRVEEVKAKLLDTQQDHLTILSIGLDAGFNSKASFNRVFKSYTGLTPKEFKVNNSGH
ncbi:MAG: helix-turn-helix transcriptional regulator [Cytophagales bacterium]|nr:helix-turn-helix transcriptional regulator [Cytophagales bacterium]